VGGEMVLRNILIIATSSGLPLFHKEFVNAISQPRLIGSLLATIMNHSVQMTTMPLAYIELSNISVAIVKDEITQLCCTIFYDRVDGPSFGKLIASQILHSFLDEYSGELATSGHNLGVFNGFDSRIAPAVRSSVRPVLVRLKAHRSQGIHHLILVSEDSIIQVGGDADQLAVTANVQTLLQFASEVLSHRDDDCTHMVLDGPPNGCRVLLWRIQRAVLIALVTKAVPHARYHGAVQDALKILTKIFKITANNRLTMRSM